MKVVVVGGGVFGCSIAWLLAKNNYNVTLLEKREDLFTAASGINQYRIHRGYHYPRSKETILLSQQGEKSFVREYADAIKYDFEHYYAIANEGSFTTASDCMKVWDDCSLEYKQVDLDILSKQKIKACLQVRESLFDPHQLKEICWDRLRRYNVKVLLNTEANQDHFKDYDLVVIATYSMNNSLLQPHPHAIRDYQFEVCEKLVLRLPKKFSNKSVVILDGPFMCIDPYGNSGLFVMGNVVHAIHNRSVGTMPEIPPEFLPLLNRGIVKNPAVTNYNKFMSSAAEFMPGIEEAEHVGSMFTVRTVPPFRDHDDARPTIVEQISKNVISVFSGKIPTCIDAAEQVLQIANKLHGSRVQTNG